MITDQVKKEAARLAGTVIKAPFKATGLYPYTTPDGSPTHYRFRAELEDGSKVIRPFHIKGNEYVLGEPEFPHGKPLYRLHELSNRKDEAVWFVEGEKCANALARRGLLATTSGSANSDEKADYSPLAGRSVVLWADFDPPTFSNGKEHLEGQKHMARVAEKLSPLGCTIELIDIQKLGLQQDGSDCADWLAAHPGATAKDIEALPRAKPVVVGDCGTDGTNHSAHCAHISESEWPDLLPLTEADTPGIPANILPGWVGAYVEAVARSTQTPSAMAVMLALSTIAACIQKRFVVSPFADGGYTEPLSIWTLSVLPPASRKTAVISALTDPLSDWERDRAQALTPEIAKRASEREVMLKRIEKLKADAAREDDDLERAQLIQEVAKLKEGLPEEIRPPRLWTGDVTPERLQGLLVEHGERMTVLSDEAGIFEIMGGLYSDGRANLDVFLKGHAGSSARVDRTSRVAFLDRPALSFGLCVQPEILREFSQGSKRRFRGLGALARFLYVLPRNNLGQRKVGLRDSISLDIRNAYWSGIGDLLTIPPAMVNGTEQPTIIFLHPEAYRKWIAFSEFVEASIGPGKSLESIQDWAGKLPGAVLRIAGLMHVSTHGSRAGEIEIDPKVMEHALDLGEALISHAQAAFDLVSRDQSTDDAIFLLEWLRRNRHRIDENWTIKQADLLASSRGRFPRSERLGRALERLQSSNVLSGPLRLPTRKPTVVYQINPKVWEKDDGMA